MKYPKIAGMTLDKTNQKRFDALLETITESITFDKSENELKLTKSDIELLSWNIATYIISGPY